MIVFGYLVEKSITRWLTLQTVNQGNMKVMSWHVGELRSLSALVSFLGLRHITFLLDLR